MWWYVAKRLLQTIPVFLGATLILFILLKLRPGDPILNLAGNKPSRKKYGDALLRSTTWTIHCLCSGSSSPRTP